MTDERRPCATTVFGGGWGAAQRWVRARMLVAGAFLSTLFVLLGYRAWVLQVREAVKLREMAEDQYLRDVELPARRGRILDRNGAELAVSAEVDSIYANPRQVEAGPGAKAIAHALAKPLDLDEKDLLQRLHSRRYFAWLKRRVLPDEARRVRELKLPGVYLTREPRRYYPNRTLAGSLLGWSSLDGVGIEGLELKYDRDLKGAPAEVQGLRDALGREVLPQGTADAPQQGGHDVVTTVDKFIQYRLERAVEEGVAAHRARAASAVALDVRTGEVLAMASFPTVNPNDPTGAAAIAHDKGVRNRAVTDPFEPGSTMKTFTIAAAIEAGLTRPDEHWFCENGKMRIGPATIHDAEPIGNATTVEVLAQSSNICTAKIARRLGKDRLDAVLRRFHFGSATGVDLPGERGGMLRAASRWGEVELATISFGQGVTATQLQIASAYAAVANGGTWHKPHVVRAVLDEKGRPLAEIAPEGTRVLDDKTARTMREMLGAVVAKGGTGEKLAIPGYPAGGKTGTAQKVDPATRRYSPDKWMSSFVGFAPLDDPRVVIMVTVDEPADTHYGAAVAGPIWHDVMADTLRYLNVTPTAMPPPPAAAQQKGSAPRPSVASAPIPPATPDNDDGATDGNAATEDGDESAEASDDTREVPDFTGRSIGEVLALARRARLPVDVDGSGRAVSQSLAPGRAHVGARCRVTFAPPR